MAMADLTNDVLRLIFGKLTDLLDILRWRGVCHSWRCVPNKFNNRKVTPLLLLPNNNHLEEQPQLLNFHRNTAAQICSIGLPSGSLSKTHYCVCSHRGWLLMKNGNKNGKICLYNPLSRVHVKIPPLPKSENPNCTIGFICSQTPSDPNCTILVRVEDWGSDRICVCKSGDQTSWRSIFTITSFCYDMIYHRGQLYTIDKSGKLERFKVWKKFPVAEEVIAGTSHLVTPVKYLVESSSGELMMAVRHVGSASFDRTRFFEFFKLNWRRRAWEEVSSLGGQALLLAHDDSILVPAGGEMGFRGDCIYFVDDHWVGHSNSHSLDFGAYEMRTSNVDNFFDQSSLHIMNAARICRWFRPSSLMAICRLSCKTCHLSCCQRCPRITRPITVAAIKIDQNVFASFA